MVPFAVEYPYWNERLPEALAAFGTPFRVADAPARSADEWTAELAGAQTQLTQAENGVALATTNLRRLLAGRRLANIVDPLRGY